jgi:hypothetical protein
VSDIAPQQAFQFGGKEFILTPPVLETEILYSRFLKNRSIEELRAGRAAYGDDYQAQLGALNRDHVVGVYDWGDQQFWRSLYTDSCLAELAYLCLKQKQPNLDRGTFRDLWKAHDEYTDTGRANKIASAVWEFFKRPNSKTQPVAPAG